MRDPTYKTTMVSLFLTWTIVCFSSFAEAHSHHRHHRSNPHNTEKHPGANHQTFLEKKIIPKSFWKEVSVPARNSSFDDRGRPPWSFEDFATTHDLDQQLFQQAFEKNSRETLHQRKKIPHGFVESKATRHVISNRKSHIAEEMYEKIIPEREENSQNKESNEDDGSLAEPIRMKLPVSRHTTPSNEGMSTARWNHRFRDKEAERALNYTRKTIKASLGGAAFISCRVGHLGDRQISWIRSRDWHVLTSGKTLYTHDKRFSVLHEPGSQDWILQIKAVSMKDAGNYECQVSTGTGIISMFVHLKIVTPKAFIPGHGQYVVNRGSPISLTCFIRKSPSPPQYIFWRHEGKLLNFIKSDPQITLTTNLDFRDDLANLAMVSRKHSKRPKEYYSRLDVLEASEQHSGNYTCNTPHSKTASTYVFVTEGDKTAAVQRIDTSRSSQLTNSILFILVPHLLYILL